MFAAGPVGTAIQVQGSGYMPMHEKEPKRSRISTTPIRTLKTSLAQIPTIVRWYSFPGTNTLKIIDVIKDDLQAIVNKRVTADEGIKAAADEVSKLVK